MPRLNRIPPLLCLLLLLPAAGGAAAEPGTFKNTLGQTFVRIPAGKFTMGSPPAEKDRLDHENPHEVELTRDFHLATHEVTIGQFRQFVTETGYVTDAEKDGKGGVGYDEATQKFAGPNPQYNWRNTGWTATDDHPVVNVSWNDAQAFCTWLSKKEDKTYRLPTEAQWEYACRAGTTTAFHHGDDPQALVRAANIADATAKQKIPNLKSAVTATDGYVFTAPVGRFRKNAFGLFDMHGNVWEWCEDLYDPGRYEDRSQRDPVGPSTGTLRTFRGGSWDRPPARCRSAARGGNSPTFRNFILGFRVVAIP
jgi:formylglycine-generating enzyme required for sulfatase activity